jgi:hypothetical protein
MPSACRGRTKRAIVVKSRSSSLQLINPRDEQKLIAGIFACPAIFDAYSGGDADLFTAYKIFVNTPMRSPTHLVAVGKRFYNRLE